MKKVLWNTVTAAMLILTLSACAGTAAPVQTEDRLQITAEVPAESTAPVESEPILFSAGDELPVDSGSNKVEDSAATEDRESRVKLDLPAEPSPTSAPQATPAPKTAPASPATPVPQASQAPKEPPAPQETPAPAKGIIQFNVTTQKGTEESPSPEPSATPKPEPTPAPPVESTPPAFNINQWISYAQSYAKGAGLNLDPAATVCWDNPIAAGAHCAYLERDIQSRLNRYAKDETITDVWIWAESRSDGSYNLYIGYA